MSIFTTPVISGLDVTLQQHPVSEYKEAGITGTTANIYVPGGIQIITMTLTPTSAGTAKVQATTSIYADVVAGNALWVDWDNGSVTETTQSVCFPVTALRVVASSGTWTFTARAQ